MLHGRDFASQVEATLDRARFAVLRDVGLAGGRVDFVVLGREDLPVAALELKSPSLNEAPQSLFLGVRLAESYAATSRGLPVLVVVPDHLRTLADNRRIIALSSLTDRLREIDPDRRGHARAAVLIQPATSRTIFASMPYAEAYVDTFKAIRYAAKKVDAVAVRVDHDLAADDVVARIKAGIRDSELVVVDVSESRPSVLHEYGFAEAVGKPIVAITSTGIAVLPFNVSSNLTHQYVRGNVLPLRRLLVTAFKQQLR